MSSNANRPDYGVSAILNSSSPPPRSIFKLFSLSGRVALVTGAGRGIGLEIATAYAEAGARVYTLDIFPAPSEAWVKVQKHLEALPDLPDEILGGTTDSNTKKGSLVYVTADVTDQKQIWARAEEIYEKEGRLDVCVANAGVFGGAETLEYPADEFQKIMNVNVNGAYYTAQAAGRQMAKQGRGSIIFTASISGSIANQGQHRTAYNTSKAAVLQITRSMASELATHKIRVNSVSPGYMQSDLLKLFLDENPELRTEWEGQNPTGRLGFPDELRGVYLWLAGDAASYTTGSDIIVDGGHTAW